MPKPGFTPVGTGLASGRRRLVALSVAVVGRSLYSADMDALVAAEESPRVARDGALRGAISG